VQEAWIGARDSEEDVDFDGDALNPHFSYRDDDHFRHDVWFLDAVTALNEMRAAQTVGIQTFALWRLGAEDRSLWRVWDMPGEANASDRLKDVPPGQDVDMEGSGEILHIEARPHRWRARADHRQANRTHRRGRPSRVCPSPIVWRAMASARTSWP
jgi:peptidoglycan-N-acetylglucosamine deacetylase